MAHRLYNIPMEETEVAAEKNRIYKAATVNGYNQEFENKILRKHDRRKRRLSITMLQPQTEEVRRINLPFYPKLSNPMKNSLKKYDLHIAHRSGTCCVTSRTKFHRTSNPECIESPARIALWCTSDKPVAGLKYA